MKSETSAKLKLNDDEVKLITETITLALEFHRTSFSPNQVDFLSRLCDTLYGNQVTIKATIVNENRFVDY